MEEVNKRDSFLEEVVLDNEHPSNVSSSKELDNASIRLLNLDHLSHVMLSSEEFLLSSSLNMSRHRNRKNVSTCSDQSPPETGQDSKDINAILEHKRLYFKTPTLVREELVNRSQKEHPKLDTRRWHRHHFLSHSRFNKTRNESELTYELKFYELENYIINFFLIHPTIGSIGRGMIIEEDGTMSDACFNYLRSYERALHLLAQKSRCYSHVSILFLIVLLRNVRRLVHHFQLSPTLVDLIILSTEGIYLTQGYLYHCNISANHALRRTNSSANRVNLPEYENLNTLQKNCVTYKQNIYAECQSVLDKIFGSKEDSDQEEDKMEQIQYNDEIITNEHDNQFSQTFMVSNTISERDYNFETSLDYDKGDMLNVNTLGFNSAIDELISKWITDLCKFGYIYNKICPKPTFLANPILKLMFKSNNFTHQKLCKSPHYTNLSMHRHFKIRNLMNYLPKLPKKSTNQKIRGRGIAEVTTPVKTSPVRRQTNLVTVSQVMTRRSYETTYGTEKTATGTKYNRWKRMEERKLVDAINQHGTGKWSFFSKMYFSGKRTALQLKDKWCNLLRFQHVHLVTDKSKGGLENTSSWQFVDTN